VAVTGGFGRRSDHEFVRALIEAGLVDLETLNDRIGRLGSYAPRGGRVGATSQVRVAL
jgi:hypothetical protein